MNTSIVYLIHFERHISDRHTCQHYLGSASQISQRITDHMRGNGSRLCQVAKQRGIQWQVVRLWHGDRKTERSLKNRKNSPLLCPHCNGKLQIDQLEDPTLQMLLEILNSGICHAQEFAIEE